MSEDKNGNWAEFWEEARKFQISLERLAMISERNKKSIARIENLVAEIKEFSN